MKSNADPNHFYKQILFSEGEPLQQYLSFHSTSSFLLRESLTKGDIGGTPSNACLLYSTLCTLVTERTNPLFPFWQINPIRDMLVKGLVDTRAVLVSSFPEFALKACNYIDNWVVRNSQNSLDLLKLCHDEESFYSWIFCAFFPYNGLFNGEAFRSLGALVNYMSMTLMGTIQTFLTLSAPPLIRRSFVADQYATQTETTIANMFTAQLLTSKIISEFPSTGTWFSIGNDLALIEASLNQYLQSSNVIIRYSFIAKPVATELVRKLSANKVKLLSSNTSTDKLSIIEMTITQLKRVLVRLVDSTQRKLQDQILATVNHLQKFILLPSQCSVAFLHSFLDCK